MDDSNITPWFHGFKVNWSPFEDSPNFPIREWKHDSHLIQPLSWYDQNIIVLNERQVFSEGVLQLNFDNVFSFLF